MATLRSDLIIPEIFTPYVIEQTTQLDAFLASGVVQPMAELNATEGGDFVQAITAGAGALETGDHHHLASVDSVLDSVGADPEDSCPAMGGFRGDAHLRSGHRRCTDPLSVQGHGQQGDRHLFATGQKHVHLALCGGGGDGVGQTG